MNKVKMTKSIIKNYLLKTSLKQVKKDLEKSKSWNEFCQQRGLKGGGSKSKSIKIMKNFCRENNITDEYLKKIGLMPWSLEDFLNNKHKINPQRLKFKLIGKGYMRDECVECGIGPQYNNKYLCLQLDHINGVHTDNSLQNLRILCPNCHSQTATYAGKCRDAQWTKNELDERMDYVKLHGITKAAKFYSTSRHLLGSRLRIPGYQ